MDLRNEAILLHVLFIGVRTIGRVRPNSARRVALVENLGQARAVMRRGVRHGKAPDKPVGAVDRYMVLVAEYGDRNFDLGFLAVLGRSRVGAL